MTMVVMFIWMEHKHIKHKLSQHLMANFTPKKVRFMLLEVVFIYSLARGKSWTTIRLNKAQQMFLAE